jgi:nucleotide-binding universal stress UspA family protein
MVRSFPLPEASAIGPATRVGIGADSAAENPAPRRVVRPDAPGRAREDDGGIRKEDDMSKRVVLGLDGSQDSMRAIPYAVEQAGDGGKIVVVHVRELLVGRAGGLPLAVNEDEIEAGVRRQVDDLKSAGIASELKLISAVAGGPAHVIADVAREVNADVIIVGTRGHRQIASLIIGSVTHKLLHMTPCPVLAVPPAAGGADSRVGSPTPSP